MPCLAMVIAVNRIGIGVLISSLLTIVRHHMRCRQKATFMLAVFNGDAGAVRRVGAWQKSSGVFMQDDLFKFPGFAVIPALIHKRRRVEGCHEDHDLTGILINDACS